MLTFGVTGYYLFKYKYFPEKSIRSDRFSLQTGTKADSIVVLKGERTMKLYNSSRIVKNYSVSLGKNPEGDKVMEGDKKTPEGKYSIIGRNPDSKYHLSLRISYPDDKDKLEAARLGVSPGGDIMIHGLPNITKFLEDYYANTDWTDGCIAVTNKEIEELWNAVDDNTPVIIYP